jgi:hypothetical protein
MVATIPQKFNQVNKGFFLHQFYFVPQKVITW